MVIDSSALVAVLQQEPDALEFTRAMGSVEQPLLSALTYLETAMVLVGRRGPGALSGLDALLAHYSMQIVPLDAALVLEARAAFLRYGKGRHPAALNMGDCAAYALAKSRRLPLLFKGNDFARTDITRAL